MSDRTAGRPPARPSLSPTHRSPSFVFSLSFCRCPGSTSSIDPVDARVRQRERREWSRERNRRSSAEQRATRAQRAMIRTNSNGASQSSSASPRTKADARLTLRQLSAAAELAGEDAEHREEEEEEEEEQRSSAPLRPQHVRPPDSLSTANSQHRTIEDGEGDSSSSQPQPPPSPAPSAGSLSQLFPASSVTPSDTTPASGEALYERRFEHADPFSRQSFGQSPGSPSQWSLPQLREAVSAQLERLDEEQLRLWLRHLDQGEDGGSDTETKTEGEGESTLDRADRAAAALAQGEVLYSGVPAEERGQSRPRRSQGRGRKRRPPLSSDAASSHGHAQPHPSPHIPQAAAVPTRSPTSSSTPASLLLSTSPSTSASPSSSRLPSSLLHRDWNESFQSLLSQVNDDETVLDNQAAFEQLSELAADFAFTARAIGRLIISEKYLAPAEKTIKPYTMGGVAGGEKYVVHNIVFKFQVDHLGMYGGDENAMAAGNHELLGLSAYYRVISTMRGLGIHVPLACLIDYRGFRLWAVSRLPVKRTKTLILGSSDGGQRIVNLDPNASKSMERIAAVLNLKGHYVQDASGKSTFLFGPFDIEVHRGSDNRVYLLDFHRTFPPEPTSASQHLPDMKRPFLVRMLRPELVAQHSEPLSSDAFMRGGAAEEAEVSAAYQLLLDRAIPGFARQLDALGSIDNIDRISTLHQQQMEKIIRARALAATPTRSASIPDLSAEDGGATITSSFGLISRSPSPGPSAAPSPVPSPPPSPGRASRSMAEQIQVDPIAYAPRFISYLHQAGINIRYLGLLRSAVTTPSIRDFLLVEMLARVLKGDMRRRWREKMAVVKHLSDGDRRCSLDFVNLVFCRSATSTAYWQQSIRRRLQDKFRQALTKEEAAMEFDLKAALLPLPDDRESTTSPFSPTSTNSSAGGGRQLHPLPPDPFQLSAAAQERLNRMLRTATTTPSSSFSAADPSAASNPISPAADSALTSPQFSTPPSVKSTSSQSTGGPRTDLLRLVFLRFIHLTGLMLQEGLIPSSQRIYNEPSVPLPLAQGASGRWAERRRSGNWDSQQPTVDPAAISRPVSPSSIPAMPATHPLSLPPRLPSGSGGLRRLSHGSSHQLPTLPNLRSQTTQPSTSTLPRSHSSTTLQPPPQSPHRPLQFSFTTSSTSQSSSATESSTSEAGASAPPAASPYFIFYDRPMEDVHLASITEQVKSLNIVSYAEGTALLCKCVSKARREDGSSVNDQQNAALAAYLADLSQAKFRESLRRDIDDCLSLCNFSMLAALVYRDMEQAKGLLLSALRANPRHHRSYYYLAQLFHYELREPRVAEWLYREALKLNPSHVNTHKDWGNLLYFSHNSRGEAELHYRKAVELQPNHIKAQMRLAWCLAEKAKEWKDFDAVLDCCRAAANSHYGEQLTRSKAQATFISMLIVKGQLHAERKEDARAVECFEEAIAFRPPALLPYQVAQSSQLGLHFPPAAALAVYAQFEARRRWRPSRAEQSRRKAEQLFLQAIQIQTQLPVDWPNNALILTTPPPTLPPQPSYPSSTPPSSTSVLRVHSPVVTSGTTLSGPQGGVLTPASAALPTSPLPRTSQWAVGSPTMGSASPALSPTAAASGMTRATTQVGATTTAPSLYSASAFTSQRVASPTPLLLPAAPAITSAVAPTATHTLQGSPAPVAAHHAASITVAAPSSTASASSPSSSSAAAAVSAAAASVWKQTRQWMPDLASPVTLPSPNDLRRKRLTPPAASASRPAQPAPLRAPLAAPTSSPTSRPAVPAFVSPALGSGGKESADAEATAVDAVSPDVDGEVEDEELHEQTQPLSPTVSEVLEGEPIGSLPRHRLLDGTASAWSQPSSASSSSLSSASSPTSTHPRRQSASGLREQLEAAEKAEEERAERSCVDTRLVRLYADHLHHLGERDAAQRWYLTAITLCPFGRQGSLNLAKYADFLGRSLHLQYDAQRAFHRAIASPCPAREALLTYAAYLREDLLDEKTADALIAQANAGKPKESNAEHRCHRTRARWYCDGYCRSHEVKPLIDLASHWRLDRSEGAASAASFARSQQGQRQRPLSSALSQPQPRRAAAINAPPTSVTHSALASAPAVPAPSSLPTSSVTGGYAPLSFSPPLAPMATPAPIQPRASWAAVCQLPPAHSGGQPPSRPTASPPTHNVSHTGGFSPPPSSTSSAHLPPTLFLSASPTGSSPVRVTALPVFAARPLQSAAVKAKASTTSSTSTSRPTVSASPTPLPLPGPSPSLRTARG